MKYSILLRSIGLGLLCFNLSCWDDHDDSHTTQDFGKFSVGTYGGSNNESGRSLVATSDGGYAVLGYTQSINGDILNKTNTDYDYWLLKFDANHNLEWQKTYGGSLDDKAHSIILNSDGGFTLFGSSESSDGNVTENAGAEDFWVVRVDDVGNIMWQKSFGYLGFEEGHSITVTNDGGYIVVGELDIEASEGLGNSKSIRSSKHVGGNYWAIKLNSEGTKEWSRHLGGSLTDIARDVIQTLDDGFVIVGSSESIDGDISSPKGTYDFWVVKLSKDGNLEWERSYGGSEIDEAWSITHANDGNYLIIGDSRSNNLDIANNNGSSDLWLIKIAPSGELLWEKTFGGSSFDAGRSISKTQDGNFVICGNSRSSDKNFLNNGENDVWIMKINSNATIIWQNFEGGTNIDLSFDVIQLQDLTMVAVGETSSSNFDMQTSKGLTDLLIIHSMR